MRERAGAVDAGPCIAFGFRMAVCITDVEAEPAVPRREAVLVQLGLFPRHIDLPLAVFA